MKKFFILMVVLTCASSAFANLKLAGLFTDDVILQQGGNVPIWGFADPGQKVTIRFANQTKKTITDENGRWQVTLDAMKQSSDPRKLIVMSDNETVEIKGVLVGQVWLCSGQSNMAMTLPDVDDAKNVMAAADYPLIRMFRAPESPAMQPRQDVKGNWIKCSPDTAGAFSATGYFFAKKLHQQLDTPVGIIVSAWGGSTVDAWMSRTALNTPFMKQHIPYDRMGNYVNMRPQKLYNGMLAPLVPYAFKGVIWYQGESDAYEMFNPYLYRYSFKAMIEDWRRIWNRPDLPFCFVQLPNLFGGRDWQIIRESQDIVNRELANVDMITTIDIGQSLKGHPGNKDVFAERLADMALAEVYQKSPKKYYPSFKSMKVKGLEVTIEFDGAKKFKTKDAQSPLAFELAGSDKIFKPAIAVIQGTKIILQSEQVVKPIAIRYAWGADPKVNLVNELDLPVRPFRTDEWPVRGSSLFAQPLESKAKLDEKYSPQSIVKEEIPGWKWCGQGIDTEIFGKENVVQFFGHDDIQLLVMGQRKAKWKQLPSPALAWEKKIENTKNGLTFEIEAQMYRANIPYKGISLQVTLADDKITKTYRIDFAPMHIYAYREDYTDVIAYNIDNGTRYHKYRIAIRPDGVAQVYFDNELAGMAVAGVVTDTAESGSYIRFGKLETQGDITVNIGSVSFDKTGAYAP